MSDAPPRDTTADLESLAARLAAASEPLESRHVPWPSESLAALRAAGVLRWTIPAPFGGTELDTPDLLAGYARLAQACLTTTFVLTQRDAAVARIAASQNEGLRDALLPGLAEGTLFATVGISHLTTSRQHAARPSVTAERIGKDWILDGQVPWVTGAGHADVVVTGGTCDDGRQILVALETSAAGVRIEPPLPLLALDASSTGSMNLAQVRVGDDRLLAGPIERVVAAGGRSGTGSFTTSAVATGAAAGSIARLAREAERRPDLRPAREALEAERAALWSDLVAAAEHGSSGTEEIRLRANSLALRAAQALLAASKGAGFVRGHPAERAVREALFFQVWSCPAPVVSAALCEFAGLAP
jgi:alkylation response protein AidB-like acyl-CoA dehydrogenase